MLFRKKMKLTDFLEGPYLDTALEKGSFRHEGFYGVLSRMLSEPPRPEIAGGREGILTVGVGKDIFTATFLGAFLWLLKYRSLSSSRNSPRKLAFLDMLFDIEMPRMIDRRLGAYDTERVKKVYEHMDIRCKKVYTADIPEGEPPPFLVSPIWAEGVQPRPFETAARVFLELVLSGPAGEKQAAASERLAQELAGHFNEMTAPLEKVSSRINFRWSSPQETPDPPPDEERQGP